MPMDVPQAVTGFAVQINSPDRSLKRLGSARQQADDDASERVARAEGGLMAYGPDFDAVFRRAASLTDRILRGARPTDLPIERPTKFHFSLNRATARALNIELPTSLLLRADEVIE
jgi:hypothetical protein